MDFQIAKASVIGADHVRAGRNNQDAFCVRQDGDRLVVVVCDGCSSGAGGVSRNEFGALFGAEMIAYALWESVRHGDELDWNSTWYGVVDSLREVDRCMGRPSRDRVLDTLLFTVVAGVVTPERATFAAIGDGVVFVNGQRVALGPFPNNMPPYIGYALVESAIPREQLKFNALASLPTSELRSFLVGTDGVQDLIDARDALLPSGRPVGPIERLWEDDRFFGAWKEGQFVENPDLLRRHLALVNGGVDRKHRAHLHDDTTLVVGRRRTSDGSTCLK